MAGVGGAHIRMLYDCPPVVTSGVAGDIQMN